MDTHPNKYHNLIRAREAGCTIPETLLLSEHELTEKKHARLTEFLRIFNPAQQFIIRSAVWNEDTDKKTHAGYYYSPGPVTQSELEAALTDAYAENRRRADRISKDIRVDLMVAPFIAAEVGGIAFTPWLYFHNHSLVEYADTPRRAVAGEGVTATMIPLGSDFRTNLTTPWQKKLSAALEKLRAVFPTRIDIEWCYADDTLYILQVRPVIIAPTATESISPDAFAKQTGHIIPNTLVQNEYSRELGKLSPLSTNLLNFLYANAERYWDALDITGNTTFLTRLPNGETLTDTDKYAHYMHDRHFYSAFTRAYKKTAILSNLKERLRAWKTPSNISIPHIQEAFDYWHIAQTLEVLSKKNRSVKTYPGEYELSEIPHEIDYGTENIASEWKERFMRTLMPLRRTVRANPELCWKSLPSATKDTPSMESGWHEQYASELPFSLFALRATDNSQSGSVHISGGTYTGPAKVIANPQTWRGALPHGHVIITPYIPPSWIPELPHLSGIMVVSLGQLAHAAIVLREHSVPATAIPQTHFEKIKDGDTVTI